MPNDLVTPNRLDIQGLAVSVGSRRLLSGLSFSLESGQRLAVTGPSGCGKTSLLKVVAGLSDPAEGAVMLNGVLPGAHGWPRFRRHVGLVAQTPVFLDATLEVNLTRAFSYATAAEQPDPDRRGKMLRLLAALGLREEHLAQRARLLSVGEQQRAALVRTLLVEPMFLLLDEPTSALDEGSRARVEALLMETCDGVGPGLVVVTHDQQQAERLCSSTVELECVQPPGSEVA